MEKNGLLDYAYDMVHQPIIAKQNENLAAELYLWNLPPEVGKIERRMGYGK